MRKLNILLGVLLIITGAFFLINGWQKILGVLFCVGGIVSVVSDLLFTSDKPNDERIKEIKVKGGHISYLFSIIYTFLIILLYNYGVIKDPLNGFIFILIGNILVFPLTLFYYNKTM
jgi:drug/metabolite transporter (DMT)-like permease